MSFHCQSARRCRQRNMEMTGKLAGAITSTVTRLNIMENRLNNIEGHLRSQGILSDSLPNNNQGTAEMETSTIQQNIYRPSQIGNQSDNNMNRESSPRIGTANVDDDSRDDISELIRRCLEDM